MKKAFSETGKVILGDFVHSERNILTAPRLQRNSRYAYQNFSALVLIAVGYLLTPFGENGNPWVESTIIIPIVVVVNYFGRKIAKYYAGRNYPENAIVDKDGNEIKEETT